MLLLILRFVSVFKILLTMRAAPQSRRLILSSYPPPPKKKKYFATKEPPSGIFNSPSCQSPFPPHGKIGDGNDEKNEKRGTVKFARHLDPSGNVKTPDSLRICLNVRACVCNELLKDAKKQPSCIYSNTD